MYQKKVLWLFPLFTFLIERTPKKKLWGVRHPESTHQIGYVPSVSGNQRLPINFVTQTHFKLKFSETTEKYLHHVK